MRRVAPGPAARRCGALIFAGAVPDDVTGEKPNSGFLAQLTSAIARPASSSPHVGADLTDLRRYECSTVKLGNVRRLCGQPSPLPCPRPVESPPVWYPVTTLGQPRQWVEIDAIGILAPGRNEADATTWTTSATAPGHLWPACAAANSCVWQRNRPPRSRRCLSK